MRCKRQALRVHMFGSFPNGNSVIGKSLASPPGIVPPRLKLRIGKVPSRRGLGGILEVNAALIIADGHYPMSIFPIVFIIRPAPAPVSLKHTHGRAVPVDPSN